MKPVFIHINKTAGTSIRSSAADRIRYAGHQTAERWVAEHGRFAPTFAVVRHPYERMRSEYTFRRGRWEGGEDNPHFGNLSLPFDEWIVDTFDRGSYRTRGFFDRTGISFAEHNMVDDILIWFLPQHRWLCGDDGELLVDDVLRFEHLDRDWAAFADRHDLDRGLPHANGSGHVAFDAEECTPAAKRVIAHHHRADFEAFGYDT